MRADEPLDHTFHLKAHGKVNSMCNTIQLPAAAVMETGSFPGAVPTLAAYLPAAGPGAGFTPAALEAAAFAPKHPAQCRALPKPSPQQPAESPLCILFKLRGRAFAAAELIGLP